MMRNLKISIKLPTKELMPIFLKVLLPETRSPTTSRSKVTITGDEQLLMIEVKAKDLVALRATYNSYLRWVSLVVDIYNILEQLEQGSKKTLN